MLRRAALPNGHRDGLRRPAAQNANRRCLADSLTGQQVEQVVRRGDRLAIERQNDVSYDQSCFRRGAIGSDRYHQQRFVASVCALAFGQLDALAGDAGDRFRLIVVSQDMAGKRDVDPFFAKQGFKALKPYLDKQNVLMEALKAETLPMTVLYDARGKELWRVVGAFDWAGDEAKALIDEGDGA